MGPSPPSSPPSTRAPTPPSLRVSVGRRASGWLASLRCHSKFAGMHDLKSLLRSGLLAAALLGGAADAFATTSYFKVRLSGAEAGVATAGDGAAFLRYD